MLVVLVVVAGERLAHVLGVPARELLDRGCLARAGLEVGPLVRARPVAVLVIHRVTLGNPHARGGLRSVALEDALALHRDDDVGELVLVGGRVPRLRDRLGRHVRADVRHGAAVIDGQVAGGAIRPAVLRVHMVGARSVPVVGGRVGAVHDVAVGIDGAHRLGVTGALDVLAHEVDVGVAVLVVLGEPRVARLGPEQGRDVDGHVVLGRVAAHAAELDLAKRGVLRGAHRHGGELAVVELHLRGRERALSLLVRVAPERVRRGGAGRGVVVEPHLRGRERRVARARHGHGARAKARRGVRARRDGAGVVVPHLVVVAIAVRVGVLDLVLPQAQVDDVLVLVVQRGIQAQNVGVGVGVRGLHERGPQQLHRLVEAVAREALVELVARPRAEVHVVAHARAIRERGVEPVIEVAVALRAHAEVEHDVHALSRDGGEHLALEGHDVGAELAVGHGEVGRLAIGRVVQQGAVRYVLGALARHLVGDAVRDLARLGRRRGRGLAVRVHAGRHRRRDDARG